MKDKHDDRELEKQVLELRLRLFWERKRLELALRTVRRFSRWTMY